jgi:hypothetical protein
VVSGPALVIGVDEGIDPGGSVDERGGTDVAAVDVAGTVAVGVIGVEFGTAGDVTGELGVVGVGVDIAGAIDRCGAQHASICTRLDSSLPPN